MKAKPKAKITPVPRKKTAAELERRANDARSLRSKRIVLQAATTLFVEKGYVGFSLNVIVRETGVSKTTIYRHWPTQSHLLTEVLVGLAKGLEIPDCGSLREDLLEFHRTQSLSMFNDRKNSAFLSIGSLLQTAEHDPGLVHIVNFSITAMLNTLRVMLERGKVRGEVRANCGMDSMIYLLYGAMYTRRLVLNEDVGNEQFAEMIDLALDGIALR